MFKKNEKGLLSLEASICLSIFIFLMLFMYSFFVMFEARNTFAHAVLATADSLSFDPVETEHQETAGIITDFLKLIYNDLSVKNPDFVSTTKWYKKEKDNLNWNDNIYFAEPDIEDADFKDDFGNSAYVSADFKETLTNRFWSYLVGSTKKTDIEAFLKRYHVVDGMNGIDFSKSKIVNGDLYIIVSYKLDYEFDMFNVANVTFEHSSCSKLWK